MNKQKFVHYVIVTFTYSIGIGTAGLLVFSLITAFNRMIM